MSDEGPTTEISLVQAYLEFARAAAAAPRIKGARENSSTGRNAKLGLATVPVIYSCMAVEALVNYHLYAIWERRHDESRESRKFLKLLGDCEDFKQYGGKRRFRELKERVRLWCEIGGLKDPAVEIPKVWTQFVDLAKRSRRFLVHPFQDPEKVNEMMQKILVEGSPERFPKVAEEVIRFLLRQGMEKIPEWLDGPPMYRIDSITVLSNASEEE